MTSISATPVRLPANTCTTITGFEKSSPLDAPEQTIKGIIASHVYATYRPKSGFFDFSAEGIVNALFHKHLPSDHFISTLLMKLLSDIDTYTTKAQIVQSIYEVLAPTIKKCAR
jgi:hypothetical protein